MTAVLLSFPSPSYRAACQQVDEAIADIRAESRRIEASYRARQQRIEALLKGISADARISAHDWLPSDSEPSEERA